MRFTTSMHSEQGLRPEQSDRLVQFPFPGGMLVAVLDGVGSYKGGDLAATAVAREMVRYAAGRGSDFQENPVATLEATIQAGKAYLADMNGATTCTALLLLEDGRAAVGHIGDCALFLERGAGELAALTRPDRTPPDSSGRTYLTKALHSHSNARTGTDFKVWLLGAHEPGDVYLLASDGCYEGVPWWRGYLEGVMLGAAQSSDLGADPARHLVSASITAGGEDNSSAIIVKVHP